MAPSSLKLYHDQTLIVEDLIEDHPEFNPRLDSEFTEEECLVFETVFLPDWDKYQDDYRIAFQPYQSQPQLLVQSQEILKKFFVKHGVDPTGLLIAE